MNFTFTSLIWKKTVIWLFDVEIWFGICASLTVYESEIWPPYRASCRSCLSHWRRRRRSSSSSSSSSRGAAAAGHMKYSTPLTTSFQMISVMQSRCERLRSTSLQLCISPRRLTQLISVYFFAFIRKLFARTYANASILYYAVGSQLRPRISGIVVVIHLWKAWSQSHVNTSR